jgi:plastocyanin
MRKILLRLAALSLVALLLFAPTAGAQGKNMTVSIKNFAFNPPNMTVAPGTTLTWVNNDQVPHTATATNPAGVFDSGTLQPGQSYSFTFNKPGTYAYHCAIHPYMTGTVTVSGASASAGRSSMASSSMASSSMASSSMTSPTASTGTQLPSTGGPSLGGLAALALVISGVIALVLLLLRRAAS